jgi:hypothetical protein
MPNRTQDQNVGISYAPLNQNATGNDYLQVTNQMFSAFSGADMQAIMTYIDGSGAMRQRVIATLNSLAISVVRDVNPLWGMGSPDFRSVTKGRRAISGSMTFTVFDRDPIMRDLYNAGNQKVDAMWEALQSIPMFQNSGRTIGSPGKNTTNTMFSGDPQTDQYLLSYPGIGAASASSSENPAKAIESVRAFVEAAKNLHNIVSKQPLRYADQLAPFDVTITMANESGAASVAAVRQVYIVSQAVGWAMNEQESDQVHQFIARYYEPLTPVVTTGDSGPSRST